MLQIPKSKSYIFNVGPKPTILVESFIQKPTEIINFPQNVLVSDLVSKLTNLLDFF